MRDFDGNLQGKSHVQESHALSNYKNNSEAKKVILSFTFLKVTFIYQWLMIGMIGARDMLFVKLKSTPF